MLELQEPKRNHQSPDPAAAASIASVFGNDDLLIEILLRVNSPTWLVRAALVCRSWHRVASDPDVLRRFRALHPPRILGLSVLGLGSLPRLLPIPQPPELAAAARRAGTAIGALRRYDRVLDCRNGRLLVEIYDGREFAVRSLLHAGQNTILPRLPPLGSSLSEERGLFHSHRLFLLKDDADDASCLFLHMSASAAKVCAHFSILQSGVWGVQQSAVVELQQDPNHAVLGHKLVLGSKVYMMTTANGCILVLDLANASFFILELPEGAGWNGNIKFSRAQHSGLYLIDATGFQLRVWHGDGAGQWALVDTISVSEACNHLNVQRWEPDDGDRAPVWVVGVGDNAEFVILELVASGIVCCMQLGNRVVEKVAEGVLQNFGASVRPVSMVWPPIFPVID